VTFGSVTPNADVLFLTWQFWALLHLAMATSVAVVAWRKRCRWMAAGALIGVSIGGFLAVVPLLLMMERAEAETGYGAGNAGVFFACTVPLVPAIGMIIGAALGVLVDSLRP